MCVYTKLQLPWTKKREKCTVRYCAYVGCGHFEFLRSLQFQRSSKRFQIYPNLSWFSNCQLSCDSAAVGVHVVNGGSTGVPDPHSAGQASQNHQRREARQPRGVSQETSVQQACEWGYPSPMAIGCQWLYQWLYCQWLYHCLWVLRDMNAGDYWQFEDGEVDAPPWIARK